MTGYVPFLMKDVARVAASAPQTELVLAGANREVTR